MNRAQMEQARRTMLAVLRDAQPRPASAEQVAGRITDAAERVMASRRPPRRRRRA